MTRNSTTAKSPAADDDGKSAVLAAHFTPVDKCKVEVVHYGRDSIGYVGNSLKKPNP